MIVMAISSVRRLKCQVNQGAAAAIVSIRLRTRLVLIHERCRLDRRLRESHPRQSPLGCQRLEVEGQGMNFQWKGTTITLQASCRRRQLQLCHSRIQKDSQPLGGRLCLGANSRSGARRSKELM
jgi:hypothetical protein